MLSSSLPNSQSSAVHSWLRQVKVVYIPGSGTSSVIEKTVPYLLDSFTSLGHIIQDKPDDSTDILLTTASYEVPIHWRKSLLFTGRIRYKLTRSPTVFTLIHVNRKTLEDTLFSLEKALRKNEPDPADFNYPGLSPKAYHVLYQQGRRGGPILTLERLLQAQSKSIHILLLVDEGPLTIFHFDLVGAYPESKSTNPIALYQDVALRMVTIVSTHEVTEHIILDTPIPRSVWNALKTPPAMLNAANQLGKRNFFSDMIRINELVSVPAISDAISSQYSEGCFATWDQEIKALITTVTGSAKPVDKGSITEDDLAIVVGIRPNRKGAIVRHVEGKQNYSPSSEAFEMVGMDELLPRAPLPSVWGNTTEVPVLRSKLHGHRGIKSYNPTLVEFVPLDPPYYSYPVSCATEAQAEGIIKAFLRSVSLNNPSDPRQIVFTVLPTHGVVIAEKWVYGAAPLQTIWEYFDTGNLVVDNSIPQGEVRYSLQSNKMVLEDF